MIYKVITEEGAEQDLRQIVDYMKNIYHSTKVPTDFLDRVKKKFTMIAKEPHLYPNEWIYNRLYYKVLIKQYVLAYYIDESSKTIHDTSIGHTLQKHRIKR